MITPIIPLSPPHSSPVVAGRKGAGLYEITRSLKTLYNTKVTVPTHFVIPVDNSKTRGIVITKKLDNNRMYAVRSSGPVSMPGMMSTILNVPKSGIQEAVCKVWDSYNSEHCLAYRTDREIPDTGTAVVIQEMVPDIEISGVIFTTSPASFFNKGSFKPEIEYVEGSGEELVGGTKTPMVMVDTHNIYGEIVAAAERLFNSFGDSDIEFSFSKTTGLNILQCRPIVFAPTCLDDIDVAADKFICKGKSIAANGIVSGVLRVANDPKALEPDTIIYLDSFTPENYRFLHSAVGIITNIGGNHCHAAIVGRELGKIVISDVSFSSISQYRGQRILMRGPQSVICTVKDGVSTDHHETEKVNAMVDVDDSFRLPAIHTLKRWCGPSTHAVMSGPSLVAHFYNRYNDYLECKVTDELMLDEIQRAAKLMSTYLYATCCGEIRHGMYIKSKESDDDSVMEFLINKCKLGKHNHNFISEIAASKSRPQFLDTIIFQPTSLEQAIETMSSIDHVFRNGEWGGSYGGKKWADISNIWLKFARKELTAMLFLDAAFNLAHNGGSVFGKVSWLVRGSHLKEVLNSRRIGDIDRMIKFAYVSCTGDALSAALAGPIISDKCYEELLLNEPEGTVIEGGTCTLTTAPF